MGSASVKTAGICCICNDCEYVRTLHTDTTHRDNTYGHAHATGVHAWYSLYELDQVLLATSKRERTSGVN